MLFDSTFRNYLAQRPAAVMMRATLEHIFAAEAIDELFDRTAQRQYTEELTFSTVVALLEAVVFRRHPSVRSAYTHSTTDIPVSLSSLYEKLNHTEPGLAEELVRHTATRLRAVAECWPTEADPVAGLRLKQLDGNYLAGTDRRLGELRGHGAAALPGLALVVRDDRTSLLCDLIACEDAYAQERSLVGRVLECVGVRLDKPTTDGDTEIRLRTNLPVERASAATVAEVYRRRWRIEASFLELTTSLRCEVDTLGYPKAAVLGFALAVCACNALSVVCMALAHAQAETKADTKVAAVKERWEASSYAVAVELRVAYDGLVSDIPNAVWKMFALWSASQLADWLVGVARNADRKRYRKSKRGPKKPVERVKAGPMAAHRSTARLLAQRTKPPKPAPRP